jgi:hypothetical protein
MYGDRPKTGDQKPESWTKKFIPLIFVEFIHSGLRFENQKKNFRFNMDNIAANQKYKVKD